MTAATKRLKTMICTYLEPEQVEALGALSKKEKRPKAEIIREAIARYITNAERKR